MDSLAIFANLKNRPTLVVGAGAVAYSKIQLLLQAGAQVQVIAEELHVQVQALVNRQQVSWLKKIFAADDVNTALLTIAASDNPELNQQVAQAGVTYNRLVNVADQHELCSVKIATQPFTGAEPVLQNTLNDSKLASPTGHVTLVGAGPGDAGLLTIKGFQALQAADVVLYDALVGEEVLNFIRHDAQRVSVGKRANNHSVAQEQTNQLLLDYVKQGLRVVRLKGGDPFVFGRGAEELEVLQQAGASYSIVPGITAALGATAYAGIPLTHRHYAQAALLITGHCRADGDEIDWPSLARARQTLVVYIGTIKAAEISSQLIAQGKATETPVAIISQGTLPNQQVQIGTLSTLAEMAQHAIRPALIVIGEVVKLHDKLNWFAD